MKFGGSSLSKPERIRNAARIVQQFSQDNEIVVVASALGEVTDLLLELGNFAVKGEARRANTIRARLQEFHSNVAKSIAAGPDRKSLARRIDQLNSELQKTVDGIVHFQGRMQSERDFKNFIQPLQNRLRQGLIRKPCREELISSILSSRRLSTVLCTSKK